MLSITKATLPKEAQIMLDVFTLSGNNRSKFSDDLVNDDLHFWIVRYDGKPVGFYTLKYQNNKVDIRDYGVIPEYDTRNISSKLIHDALKNMSMMRKKLGLPY